MLFLSVAIRACQWLNLVKVCAGNPMVINSPNCLRSCACLFSSASVDASKHVAAEAARIEGRVVREDGKETKQHATLLRNLVRYGECFQGYIDKGRYLGR